MLFILNGIGNSALRGAIKAHAAEAKYPITEDDASATFFIGMMKDSFPVNTPPENRIILKDPNTVDTVPSGAHLFSYFTLIQLDTADVTLCKFLTNELKRQQK